MTADIQARQTVSWVTQVGSALGATGLPRRRALLPLAAGDLRGGNHAPAVRLSTPSFCRIAETCALMVASETPSS